MVAAVILSASNVLVGGKIPRSSSVFGRYGHFHSARGKQVGRTKKENVHITRPTDIRGANPLFAHCFFIFFSFFGQVWRNLGCAGGSRTKSWAEQRCNGATVQHIITPPPFQGTGGLQMIIGQGNVENTQLASRRMFEFGEITGLGRKLFTATAGERMYSPLYTGTSKKESMYL